MGLIGIISSNEELNEDICKEFAEYGDNRYYFRFVKDIAAVLELLNYDLPEIVIVNFSDATLDLGQMGRQIQKDAWLHNFGIVGLYDRSRERENDVARKYKDLNILTLLDATRVVGNLVKILRIIDRNRQIIFQKELSTKLMESFAGSFVIANDLLASTVCTGLVTTAIAQRGLITQEEKLNLQVGLSELILNGIEHGNCRISYEEKSDYLSKGGNIKDLVELKAESPEVSRKRVTFEWDVRPERSKFVIRDEGEGFDVKNLKTKLESANPLALHGRGIMMARMFSHKLYYNAKGTEATLVIDHRQRVDRDAPQGFAEEEQFDVQRGDIVFHEGDTSDFLYYITTGRFSVFHRKKLVGILTPADIFMGEMSFLLNNRRSATVRAETEGKLIKISRKSFVGVIKQYPHYGLFLSKLLARKLVRSNRTRAQETEKRAAALGENIAEP